MTIDEFAKIIHESLLEMEARLVQGTKEEFTQVNTRLDETNEKLNQTNIRLDEVNVKLNETNAKLDGTNIRLDKVIYNQDQRVSKAEDRMYKMKHVIEHDLKTEVAW